MTQETVGAMRLTRREFAGMASALAAGSMTDAARRPNVVVFFTDQQRYDTCGCSHVSPLKLTPNLDRLAANGVLLENSFTCQPVCAPARACLQTGMYATQHGVWRNGIAMSPANRTLAHRFRDAGYTTGYIGKWHLAGTGAKPVPQELRGGYEYWLGGDAIEISSHPYDFRLYDGEGKEVRRPGYRVDAQTDCVLEYLRARAQKPSTPFFLFASYLEPHHQNDMNRFVAPEGYAERYGSKPWIPPDLVGAKGDWDKSLPGYYGMVKSLDENLGRVVAELEKLQIANNTIVMFATDHGCHFRTRNSEYKRSCHEASIHVPTVFSGPGFRRGKRLKQLVSTVDWTATLLDAAGLPRDPAMAGRSILPLVRGERVAWQDDLFIQISESEVGRALRTTRWKYGVRGISRDAAEQAASERYLEEYLYDLRSDPSERNNLVADPGFAAIRNSLAQRLMRRMAAAGEPRPQIVPAVGLRGGAGVGSGS